MEDRLAQLEARVARMERRARGMFLAGLGTLAGGFLMALAMPGQTQDAAISQRRGGTTVRAPFRVVDSRNIPLMDVVSTGGVGRMVVYGRPGKPMLNLGGVNAGRVEATLTLNDLNGRPAAILGSAAATSENVSIRGLALLEQDGSFIGYFGDAGNLPRGLSIYERNQTRILLRADDPTGGGEILLFNGIGENTFAAPGNLGGFD